MEDNPHFIESWVERRLFDLFSFIHEAKIFDDFTGAGREARDYREAIVGDIAPPNSRSVAEYNKDYVADITRERCGQKLILPASGSSA